MFNFPKGIPDIDCHSPALLDPFIPFDSSIDLQSLPIFG